MNKLAIMGFAVATSIAAASSAFAITNSGGISEVLGTGNTSTSNPPVSNPPIFLAPLPEIRIYWVPGDPPINFVARANAFFNANPTAIGVRFFNAYNQTYITTIQNPNPIIGPNRGDREREVHADPYGGREFNSFGEILDYNECVFDNFGNDEGC